MDLDIEKIHNLLIEANLPSSINDLKNPTEEFVIDLITTFLRRFQIDVSVLDKPTIEQEMSYCEDSDIISLTNLYVAMSQICDRIFLKDFCITDISSPSSKKVRKLAKFLANFILYANNKESDIEDRINEIQNKAKLLQDMIEKKNKVLEATNEKAYHVAKQLSLKDKYVAEIQKLQSRIDKRNKEYIELTAKVTAAEEKKQRAVELCASYKAQALKLTEAVAQLQSEVVRSPEEYEMRLSELEKQQSAKDKERQMMEEAFHDKKHLIEQQTNTLNFVQKQLEKFVEVQDMHQQLKNINIQKDNVKRQLDILKPDIAEFERRLNTQKGQHKDIEVHDLQAQYEERLSPLRNLVTQLLSNKKICKEKLEEMKMQYNDEYLKLENMQSNIKKVEEQTTVLIRNYQELYDNEILAEQAAMESLDK